MRQKEKLRCDPVCKVCLPLVLFFPVSLLRKHLPRDKVSEILQKDTVLPLDLREDFGEVPLLLDRPESLSCPKGSVACNPFYRLRILISVHGRKVDPPPCRKGEGEFFRIRALSAGGAAGNKINLILIDLVFDHLFSSGFPSA